MDVYSIDPSKSKAMILAKQQFTLPLQPLHLGPCFVKLVNSTSCLSVSIDNKVSWHSLADIVKASLCKKNWCSPELTLEEIYF